MIKGSKFNSGPIWLKFERNQNIMFVVIEVSKVSYQQQRRKVETIVFRHAREAYLQSVVRSGRNKNASKL